MMSEDGCRINDDANTTYSPSCRGRPSFDSLDYYFFREQTSLFSCSLCFFFPALSCLSFCLFSPTPPRFLIISECLRVVCFRYVHFVTMAGSLQHQSWTTINQPMATRRSPLEPVTTTSTSFGANGVRLPERNKSRVWGIRGITCRLVLKHRTRETASC